MWLMQPLEDLINVDEPFECKNVIVSIIGNMCCGYGPGSDSFESIPLWARPTACAIRAVLVDERKIIPSDPTYMDTAEGEENGLKYRILFVDYLSRSYKIPQGVTFTTMCSTRGKWPE